MSASSAQPCSCSEVYRCGFPSFLRSKAADHVIIHHPNRLHVSIDHRRSQKSEAALLQILRPGNRLFSENRKILRRTNVRIVCRIGFPPTQDHMYLENVPNSFCT